jgi:hypothetical protein
MTRQIIIICLPSTQKYKQATKSSPDNDRYPRLSGIVIKHLKNDLRTKSLQEELSALGIVCVEWDRLRNLSFQDTDNKFLSKNDKTSVLIFKVIYCTSTVHISFTQSSLYMYVVGCNTFVHISFIFNFNESVNIKYKF